MNHIYMDYLPISLTMIDLEKREEVITLYDTYIGLLTNKQRMYFEEYYFDDMTLQEIASNHEVSRNAVFDQIKKTIGLCAKYEENLNLVKTKKEIKECIKSNNIDEIKKRLIKIIEE